MSYKLLSLFILPSLLIGFALNATEDSTEFDTEVEFVEKVYTTPEDVIISDEGIFVSDENGAVEPITELHADAKGLYYWRELPKAGVLGSYPSIYDYGIYTYLNDQQNRLI